MPSQVVSVHAKSQHLFSKDAVDFIELVRGHGVQGDAHFGVTVRHRSRVARDSGQPNLRHVHLLHEELFAEVGGLGLQVLPGQMGENITTRGIDLLALATGTRLRLGPTAVVEVTGLRNPCVQIEKFKSGLLAAVRVRTEDGSLVRKAGVMSIVIEGGHVRPGDHVEVVHKPKKFKALLPV